MLALDVSGVEAYAAWLDQQAAALLLDVRNTYREWALALHAEITMLTPQWSGNLAANWMLELGAAGRGAAYIAGPARDQVMAPGGRGGQGGLYSRGMYPAVGISIERAERVGMPALADEFYIHNPVDYAQSIEDDTNDPAVRAINRVPRAETGKVAMVAHAYFKHSHNGQGLINELRSRAR